MRQINDNESKRPTISVVMPMYNQERYIEKCLKSVMEQTLTDLEIIVVNDGSTDRSPDMVRKLAENDPRIKFIDKKNTGYGNSVNIGMSKATGEYVGIVETDDFIAPDMFETLYGLTEGGTVDVVKGNFYDYYERPDRTFDAVVNTERHDMPDVTEPFTLRERPEILWGHPSVWSAIYRREFLNAEHITLMEKKGGGWVDNPFFFDTLCKARSIMWTKKPLYYYRKTSIGSSSTGVVDPDLPFDRMNDNLDVIERDGYTDDVTLRYVYSRALMYANGALKECGYDVNSDKIDAKAKALMQRCDVDVFRKYFNAHDMHDYYGFASPIRSLRSQFPKILIYNWLPYDNPWHWGGGVTIYCKNVIDTILKEYPFAQVYFLSSGFAYSAAHLDTFVRRIGSLYGERCRQYEIVNSPVPAAQDNLFVNPLVALESESLKNTFKKFIDEHGPFTAIHFNNMEGLSLDVFDLKADYPDTKFVYSIHNYVPMCVTGFYYMRHAHRNCSPDHTAADCMKCTRANIKRNIADETYKRGQFGVAPEELCSRDRWVKTFGFDRLDEDVAEDDILTFARTATEKLNKNCDHILAVSRRVYDIAAENGFDKSKMSVSYIGTTVAGRQVGKSLSTPGDGLRIVFLGNSLNYEEKGYPFLLDALSGLEPSYASRIDMVLTVRDKQHAEIYKLLKNFRSVKVKCGYTHDELAGILAGCDLSIVPVLWEDNLPQIAIESVAYGVPVLASTSGGASELCDDPLFTFKSGDAAALLDKIRHFVDRPEDLARYWAGHHGLVTMHAHWRELSGYYGLPADPEPLRISMKDYAYLIMEHEFLEQHVVTDGSVPEDVNAKLRLYDANKPILELISRENVELTPSYVRLIKKLDKMFPRGSRRRKFLKRLFGGKKEKTQ